jgi:hypothetical protein
MFTLGYWRATSESDFNMCPSSPAPLTNIFETPSSITLCAGTKLHRWLNPIASLMSIFKIVSQISRNSAKLVGFVRYLEWRVFQVLKLGYSLFIFIFGIESLGLFSFGSRGDGTRGRFIPVSLGDPNALFNSEISALNLEISRLLASRYVEPSLSYTVKAALSFLFSSSNFLTFLFLLRAMLSRKRSISSIAVFSACLVYLKVSACSCSLSRTSHMDSTVRDEFNFTAIFEISEKLSDREIGTKVYAVKSTSPNFSRTDYSS